MYEIIRNKPIDIGAVLDDAKPKGVIHCGANIAEELYLYEERGIDNVCWIEADPRTYEKLQSVLSNRKEDVIINAAVSDHNGMSDFYVMDNDGASSSLLMPTGHLVKYPTIKHTEKIKVLARTLDSLIFEGSIAIKNHDFLYMDLQGSEYFALKGFENNIKHIKYILSEINYEEIYQGCVLVDEFDEYLSGLGFIKQWATIHETVGWGDAYYKRV